MKEERVRLGRMREGLGRGKGLKVEREGIES